MHNLASTYIQQGRFKEAEELEVQVLEAQKEVLGHNHPDTLTTMHYLAYTWKHLGRHSEAIALMEECIQGRRRVLGEDHPHTQSSVGWLSLWRSEGSPGDEEGFKR
ncbi:hypothetical protein VTJ04DRAFT_1299 [Mycothermus thermophilus]|uniref:uncharacterized protein n=1 Tax=Humicola insolens TaxID=85995 RepID=UPI0037443BC6